MMLSLALLLVLGLAVESRLLPFYPSSFRDCSNLELLNRMPFLKHLEHRVGIEGESHIKLKLS